MIFRIHFVVNDLSECPRRESNPDLRFSAPSSRVPVELTALEVGRGERGREMISLDVSQFGDPLDGRSTRVPYSRYLKMEEQKDVLGEEIINSLRPLFEMPPALFPIVP